jgi:Tfp pilus assembly protein PilX
MIALRERFLIVNVQSQQGVALIIAVMILLILTVLGIFAITTSTLETRIAGNERVLKDAFYAADGGIDCGRMVISLFLTQQSPTLPSRTSVNSETDFRNEIMGSAVINPLPHVDTYNGTSDTTVKINVDRLKSEEPPGYSGEFGGPVSDKQTLIYYAVDSVSTGIANASSEIAATYRHVLHN